jgi:hypothetical protein
MVDSDMFDVAALVEIIQEEGVYGGEWQSFVDSGHSKHHSKTG